METGRLLDLLKVHMLPLTAAPSNCPEYIFSFSHLDIDEWLLLIVSCFS